MKLANFYIIVAVDNEGGIAKNGTIPWMNKDDMKFFRETTHGAGKNAVIMGRLTYESIPSDFRPLKGRNNIIISRTYKQENFSNISVYSSLIEALCGSADKGFESVFIIGGESIYKESIEDFMYLCKGVFVTKFKTDYGCDKFFPLDKIINFPMSREPVKTNDFTRNYYLVQETHQEFEYLNALKSIKADGETKIDRTGVGVKSKFGVTLEFNISERIPIITTKKMFLKGIIEELLFFISGQTNTKLLEKNGVNIWKGNTSKENLQKLNLTWEEGDMGPGYPFQLRHWGAEYKGAHYSYYNKGIDQLKKVIHNLRNDPSSRRHLVSYWNTSDIDKMALPPCHVLFQFNVSGDRQHLDIAVYQRSGDFFLGVPFNLGFYSILTHMVAHIVELKPRRMVYFIADSHIYNNHQEQVSKQLKRTPKPFPKLSFRNPSSIHEIDDFKPDDIVIEKYESWPKIEGEMAV